MYLNPPLNNKLELTSKLCSGTQVPFRNQVLQKLFLVQGLNPQIKWIWIKDLEGVGIQLIKDQQLEDKVWPLVCLEIKPQQTLAVQLIQ